MPITKEQAKAIIKVHKLDAVSVTRHGLLVTGKGPVTVRMNASGYYMIRKERP